MNSNYDLVEKYTMKCRLYPNKGQAKAIDDILVGLQKAYNIALYEITENHRFTKEFKTENGEILHYVDFKKLASAETVNWLKSVNPKIECVPAAALETKNGIFLSDMVRAMSHNKEYKTLEDGRVKVTHSKKARVDKKGKLQPYSVEEAGAEPYSKKKPRLSFTYQVMCSKITSGENKNVLHIFVNKAIEKCKIRGWNQIIRFDENHEMDFADYVAQNKSKQFTVTISKDNCGDYWICFKLSNVYKPMSQPKFTNVGVDVGAKDIVILSDGTKFENKKFKKAKKKHTRALNRRMSRRQGWANEDFRNEFDKDKSIEPSKRYQKTVLAYAKLEREIARKRNLYNNEVTRKIVESYSFIGTETLNVSGMMRNRHLAGALVDASVGSILQMLSYKSKWHHRVIQPIDQWTPSSKRCNCCGHVRPKLSLSIREWTCQECGHFHDRDVNAAKNILYFALLTSNGKAV